MVPDIQFFLSINLSFRSRRGVTVEGMGTSKRVDSTGVNGLAVRFQKLHFMKLLLVKIKRFKK